VFNRGKPLLIAPLPKSGAEKQWGKEMEKPAQKQGRHWSAEPSKNRGQFKKYPQHTNRIKIAQKCITILSFIF